MDIFVSRKYYSVGTQRPGEVTGNGNVKNTNNIEYNKKYLMNDDSKRTKYFILFQNYNHVLHYSIQMAKNCLVFPANPFG